MATTTDHSIEVEWDPPEDNGGGEILGYHVDKVRKPLDTLHFWFSKPDLKLNRFCLCFSGPSWFQGVDQSYRATVEVQKLHCLWSS